MTDDVLEIDTSAPEEWPADPREWPAELVVRDVDSDGWAVFEKILTGEVDTDE